MVYKSNFILGSIIYYYYNNTFEWLPDDETLIILFASRLQDGIDDRTE